MRHTDTTSERTVIEQVRDLMPRRPLSLTEAYSVAERQAYKLLELLAITAPHVTYDKLLQLPNLEIELEPSYLMPHFAGVSHFSKGHWVIFVDKNDVHGRRTRLLGAGVHPDRSDSRTAGEHFSELSRPARARAG